MFSAGKHKAAHNPICSPADREILSSTRRKMYCPLAMQLWRASSHWTGYVHTLDFPFLDEVHEFKVGYHLDDWYHRLAAQLAPSQQCAAHHRHFHPGVGVRGCRSQKVACLLVCLASRTSPPSEADYCSYGKRDIPPNALINYVLFPVSPG